MNRILKLILLIVMVFSTSISATSLFESKAFMQHTLYEYYAIQNPVMMIGFQFDRQFWETLYYSAGIKGAIGGTGRGGYGLAVLGAGYKWKLSPQMMIDFSGFIGSGGGGNIFVFAPGTVFQGQVGIQYEWLPQWWITGYVGYFEFPPHKFESTVLGLSISHMSAIYYETPKTLNPKRAQPEWTIPLEKTKRLSFEIKSFYYQADEITVLYGGKLKTMLGPNWYWGQAGYGAIGGNRSGYIEGGLVFGHIDHSFSPLIIDINLFIGAAGGGYSTLEGDGLLVQPSINLGLDLAGIQIYSQFGYEHYVQGEIHSIALGLSIAKVFWF